MKHVSIPGFVFMRTDPYSVGREPSYGWTEHDFGTDTANYRGVCAAPLEFDLPDDFDPRALQIETLKATKQKLMAEFSARCTEIELQISKLQAIEYEVVEA